MDIKFIEFYIYKKYDEKLEDYFNVAKSVASNWRNKKFPDKRLHEFCFREKSSDMLEMFKILYNL